MPTAKFAAVQHSPHQHFVLYFYAAILQLLEQARDHCGSAEAADERFPFLAGYFEELVANGLDGASFHEASASWARAVAEWEECAPVALPLAVLRQRSDLSAHDLIVLVLIGMCDEDPRLRPIVELLQGSAADGGIATGLLAALAPESHADVRGTLHRLERLGLIEAASAARTAWRGSAVLWNAVRGTYTGGDAWCRYQPLEQSRELSSLHLPAAIKAEAEQCARALSSGIAAAVLVRGAQHNGRSTLAAAMARAMGKHVLTVTAPADMNDGRRWAQAATLAHLLDAVLVIAADVGPSESWPLPELPERHAPLFVTLGNMGGVSGHLAERTLSISVPLPDRATREALWAETLGDACPLGHLRLTTGNIVRAGRAAKASAASGPAAAIDPPLVRQAIRILARQGLDGLARRVSPARDWNQLAVANDTLSELQTLTARCRHRERLGRCAGEALSDLGPGVRALLKGPSGTGKTLAARMLAGTLDMDLYRVDLSAVVNKYIGETEKNLERVFAHAEELDVILLLDEGDALLTQRVGVQSATDRYANLETNYLLQRLESFDGILLITTNAADRIDGAFLRRMDVVVEFGMPDAAERWAIWQTHLPATHVVSADTLYAAAQRCTLSGGQIRNASLHASLLAVDANVAVDTRHLEAAIEREYRAVGGMSPLRPRAGAR